MEKQYMIATPQILQEIRKHLKYCEQARRAVNSVFWLATWVGKMEQYCPLGIARFVPAIKFCQKSMHKSFLYQNIFCDTEKISCDFSVGMELENRKNQKTESINKNENNENKNVHKFQE